MQADRRTLVTTTTKDVVAVAKGYPMSMQTSTGHEDRDTRQQTELKSFNRPDETRSFERGTVGLVVVGGAEIGRLTLQPGWRWSEHVKPIAGTELVARPGDVTSLPEGHDAWVIGDEPAVVVDWWGASNYAKH